MGAAPIFFKPEPGQKPHGFYFSRRWFINTSTTPLRSLLCG
jgi:hypothetical protein